MLFPAYLLLLVLAVIVLPVDRVWLSAIAGPWNDPKGDVLVVLGADSIPDMIGLSSYWRAVYAVRVWREGGFRRIVLSGMRVGWQMQQFLVCQGVPAAAIVVEDRSRDTHGNAIEAARLLAGMPGRKVLLTSDYHMYRAWRAFRRAGIDVQPRPIPDGLKRISTWRGRLAVFFDLCSEAGKSVYYRAHGWI